jgi:hypothetical protein
MHSEKFLVNEIKNFFGIHLSRSKFITSFVTTLFVVQTVKLTRISNCMRGNAKKESKYKQCQRFLKMFTFDEIKLSKFLFHLFPGNKNNLYIAIDRTNWKFGKVDINILTLTLSHEGIGFPILWCMLDNNGGSSNTKQRIYLIEKFIKIFGKNNIKSILCDREFIGKDWIDYLKNIEKINFRIRVKSCEKINKVNGDLAPLKNFFRNIRQGHSKILKGKRTIWGHRLFIACVKSSCGELVIIITCKDEHTAITDYAKRWEIETFFKCLKSSGFNLEDTHLKDFKRINNLIGLISIAFVWAYLAGELVCKKIPIRIKSHGRKSESVFRVGLDLISRLVIYPSINIKEYHMIIKLLSCT